MVFTIVFRIHSNFFFNFRPIGIGRAICPALFSYRTPLVAASVDSTFRWTVKYIEQRLLLITELSLDLQPVQTTDIL